MEIVRIDGNGLRPRLWSPDPHGQAAFMLAESILHTLIETRVMSLEDALSVVQAAQEVTEEIAKDPQESEVAGTSSRLLRRIAISLEADLH